MSDDPSNDTHPTIQAMLIEGYRKMPPAEKFRRAAELSQLVREFAMADVRKKHPNATEREVRLRMASRCYDRELMIKACGWDVEKEGY